MTAKEVFLVTSAIIAIVLRFSRHNKVNWPITFGLTIGILLGLSSEEPLDTIGFILFAISALLGFTFGFRTKAYKVIEITTICLSSYFVFLDSIFSVFSWPYANELRLAMILPITAYLFMFYKTKSMFQQEYGFVTILFTYCLIQFSRMF